MTKNVSPCIWWCVCGVSSVTSSVDERLLIVSGAQKSAVNKNNYSWICQTIATAINI